MCSQSHNISRSVKKERRRKNKLACFDCNTHTECPTSVFPLRLHHLPKLLQTPSTTTPSADEKIPTQSVVAEMIEVEAIEAEARVMVEVVVRGLLVAVLAVAFNTTINST